MKNFMDENFLLQTETAQKLYHEHAAKMPIIDYHLMLLCSTMNIPLIIITFTRCK